MLDKENSYSKLNFNSYELSPLILGYPSFQNPEIQKLVLKATPRRFNAEEKTSINTQYNSLQTTVNTTEFKSQIFTKGSSIFDSKFNDIIEKNKQLPNLNFKMNSSILNSNKEVDKECKDEIFRCKDDISTDHISILKRKRIKLANNKSKNNLLRIRIPKIKSPVKKETRTLFKFAKYDKKEKHFKSIDEKIPINLNLKNIKEKNVEKSFLPKIKKHLKNYLANSNNNEIYFESALGNQTNRRNPNSIITIKRYWIKKVPKEFKDYVEKTFDNKHNINQLSDNTSQFYLKSFNSHLITFNNFTVIESKNFKNTTEILDDSFDSDLEEQSVANLDSYKIFSQKDMENLTYNGFCFGENPIEAYGILCKWYEEEMQKLEKGSKCLSNDIEGINLCMNILQKITEISNRISEMPYLRIKKKVNTSVTNNSKSRKRMKKPKIFVCEICREVFKNGCALGGHMSRIHPNKSDSYRIKRQIRKRREKYRSALKKAKLLLLKSKGFNLTDLIRQGKNGKIKIKQILKENKKEFLETHRDIKNREGLD